MQRTYHNLSVNITCGLIVPLILSILLYGCESWCLTEELLQRLRVFHAQCLRAMSRVSRKHTLEHRISSMQLMISTRAQSIMARTAPNLL